MGPAWHRSRALGCLASGRGCVQRRCTRPRQADSEQNLYRTRGEAVQQIVARHPHIGEADGAVVDAVQPHLRWGGGQRPGLRACCAARGCGASGGGPRHSRACTLFPSMELHATARQAAHSARLVAAVVDLHARAQLALLVSDGHHKRVLHEERAGQWPCRVGQGPAATWQRPAEASKGTHHPMVVQRAAAVGGGHLRRHAAQATRLAMVSNSQALFALQTVARPPAAALCSITAASPSCSPGAHRALRRANTVAALPSSAALPIHHLMAPSSGV